MIKKIFLASLVLAGSCLFAQNQMDKKELLERAVKRIGEIEKKYYSFERILQTDEMDKNGEIKSTVKLKLMTKGSNTLTVFLSPKKQKGKVFLQKDNSYYIYFPKAKKYSRISPRSGMFGGVVIGEIMTPPLLENYHYKLLRQNADTLVIEFSAKEGKKPAFYKKVSYFTIENSVDKGKLLKVENYTKSGILFGTAFYRDYVNDMPKKMRGNNILNKDGYYEMQVISDKQKNYSDDIFQPSYLKFVR